MHYTEIRIQGPAARAEDISSWLCEAGLPFQQSDEGTLDPPPPGQVRFSIYVPPDEAPALLSELQAVRDADTDILHRDRDEAEWRDAWKAYFHVRRLGRLALLPSWEAEGHVPEAGEVTLRIDPGRAFGTGGHESTRLCLHLIDELAGGGEDGAAREARMDLVLDVGCGSGVLAIAALLYAPQATAVGIDTDPEAVEVTDENADLNGVAGRLAASTTPLSEIAGEFDLVLGNLTAPTLKDLCADLCARVAPGGHLVLSGILTGEVQSTLPLFLAQGLQPVSERREGQWAALLLRRGAHDPPPVHR